jgi:hypothetical protein
MIRGPLAITALALLACGHAEPPGGVPVPHHEIPYRVTATRHILVRIKINGHGPFNVVLDTGAPVVVLAGKLKEVVGVKPDAAGWATLDKLEIEGGVSLANVTARFDDLYQLEGMNGLGLAGVEIHGLVGYPVLARYRITYDFTRPTLEWSPLDITPDELPRRATRNVAPGGMDTLGGLMKGVGKLFGMNEIPATRLRGFVGIAYDPDGTITSVLGSSPAEAAGLRVGDRLRDPSGLARAVSGKGAGDRVVVGVNRGGTDMDIEVTLGGGF